MTDFAAIPQPGSFTLTARDFTQMNRFAMFHIPKIQQGLVVRMMLIVALAIAMTAVLEFLTEPAMLHRHTFYIAAALAIIPGFLMVGVFFYVALGLLSYRLYVRGYGKSAMTMTVTLTAEGLRQDRNAVETLWKFEAFQTAYDTPKLYLAYLKDGCRAVMIPKRAFATPADGERFFALLKEKIVSVDSPNG